MTGSLTNRQRLLLAMTCSPQLEQPPFLPWGLDVLASPPHASYQPLWPVLRQSAIWKRRWLGVHGANWFLPGPGVEYTLSESALGDGTARRTTTLGGAGGKLTSEARGIPGTSAFEITKRFLTSADDVKLYLSWPYDAPVMDTSAFAALDAEVGEQGVVTHRIPDALGVVGENFEPEPFALCSVEEPGLIMTLLEIVAERVLIAVRRLLEGGARPIFILGGPEFATPPLFSPRTFDQYVVRFDRPLIDLIHSYGCKVIVHCHGRLDAVLERFVEMGADALHPLEAPPMGDVTPADAKRRVGSRLCIVGNLQIGDMMREPPQEIKRQVRRLREQAPNGLIVTTSATPYEATMSPQLLANYEAALEAIAE